MPGWVIGKMENTALGWEPIDMTVTSKIQLKHTLACRTIMPGSGGRVEEESADRHRHIGTRNAITKDGV